MEHDSPGAPSSGGGVLAHARGLIRHLAVASRRGGTSPLRIPCLSICDTTSLIRSNILAGPVHRAHKTFGAWLFLTAPACIAYLRPPCTSSARLFSAGASSSSSALDGGGVRPHHLRTGLTFSVPSAALQGTPGLLPEPLTHTTTREPATLLLGDQRPWLPMSRFSLESWLLSHNPLQLLTVAAQLG